MGFTRFGQNLCRTINEREETMGYKITEEQEKVAESLSESYSALKQQRSRLVREAHVWVEQQLQEERGAYGTRSFDGARTAQVDGCADREGVGHVVQENRL